MKFTKCGDCGEVISKYAKACPKCGAPSKKKTSIFTWVITIFVGFIFVSMFIENTDTTQSEQKISANDTVETASLEGKRKEVQSLFLSEEEPTAKDALWTADNIFKVGVVDDGTTRNGYASYVCQVLYEYGFKGKNIWVQVIDIVKLTRNGEWLNLGEERCQ